MVTLAHSDDPPYGVTKTVGLSPDNPANGLPYIGSLINLLDGKTGMPVAVMDGAWITAVRTAAITVVAARKYARPDSRSILFVGCGVQARSHLEAMLAEYPVERVIVNSRTRASAEAFAALAEGKGLAVELTSDPNAAMGEVDMVITTVSLKDEMQPFLHVRNLRRGAFAGLVDIARPFDKASLLQLDRVIIDDREQEAVLGPCIDLDRIEGDLGQLVNGAIAPRQSDSERCAFISRGMGFGDLAMAAIAYEKCLEAGLGLPLPQF